MKSLSTFLATGMFVSLCPSVLTPVTFQHNIHGDGFFVALKNRVKAYSRQTVKAPDDNSRLLGSSSVKFTRYFVQPSIGITSEHFDLALSSRFCKLGFNNFQASYFSQSNPLTELQSINNRQSYLLFEPALTLRGGWSNFKLQAQVGISYNLTNPDFAQEVTNLTIGAYVNTAKKATHTK